MTTPPTPRRWKITIEYDGTGFCGWQRQKDAPSIQQNIETAIHRFSGEKIAIQGAGRTDAGVHACGQVAHFDLEKDLSPHRITQAINAHLRPHPIVVLKTEPVSSSFDARRAAISKTYQYRLINRQVPLTLDHRRALQIIAPLDIAPMKDAAQTLIGKHDFSTFRDSKCQAKSPLRTLENIEIYKDGKEITLLFTAPSFLHHQVRNIVGTLIYVGIKKWPVHQVKTALAAKDRQKGGPTAPPWGLYLMNVLY